MKDYNWKFVQKGGLKSKAISFMFCDGDNFITEFKSCQLDYALCMENAKIDNGYKIKPTVKDYINQCNENAEAIVNKRKVKNNILVIKLSEWNKILKKSKKDKSTQSGF